MKDVSTVTAACEDVKFILKGEIIKEEGLACYPQKQQKKRQGAGGSRRTGKPGGREGIIIPQWEEGKQLPLCACSLAQGTTKPKPLHTESSLLAAMETAGKELRTKNCVRSSRIAVSARPLPVPPSSKTLFAREVHGAPKEIARPHGERTAVYSIVKEDENRQCGDDRTVGSGFWRKSNGEN